MATWGKQSSQPFHSKNVPDLCTIDSSLQRRELGPEILVQKITIFEGGGGLFRAPHAGSRSTHLVVLLRHRIGLTNLCDRDKIMLEM